MKCEACDGSGDGVKKNDHNCSICNGTGTCCDQCGESTDEGSDMCDACLSEDGMKGV